MQKRFGLCGFDDFASLDAARANANPLARAAVELGLHRTKIHIPATTCRVVSVRDVVSELRPFAAKITFGCHRIAPILVSQRLRPPA